MAENSQTNAERPDQAQDDSQKKYRSIVINAVIIMLITQVPMLIKNFYQAQTADEAQNVDIFDDTGNKQGQKAGFNDIQTEEPVGDGIESTPKNYQNIWKDGDQFEAFMYVNQESELSKAAYNGNNDIVQPCWEIHGLQYGNEFSHKKSMQIPINERTDLNKPFYAHFMIKRKGTKDSESGKTADKYSTAVLSQGKCSFLVNNNTGAQPSLTTFLVITFIVQELTTFLRYKTPKIKKKLMGSNEELKEKKDNLTEGELYPYWYPNITIAVVNSAEVKFKYHGESESVRQWMKIEEDFKETEDGDSGGYYPIIFFNDFWKLSEEMYMLNSTIKNLELSVTFDSMSAVKFLIYVSLIKSQPKVVSTEDLTLLDGIEMLKKTLLTNSPIILILTVVVTAFHSLFDFLAFKNDVQFWRKKKDAIGVSTRTMALNIVFQVIILAYLFENEKETSYVIILSNAVGIFIEMWKLYSSLNIQLHEKTIEQVKEQIEKRIEQRKQRREQKKANPKEKIETAVQPECSPLVGKDKYIIFETEYRYITIKSTEGMTQLESDTLKYDQMAFKYLSRVAYPALFSYAIYSLYTKEFRSWYSFILSVLVGFVYTFGFISMTPQLFINYKLKSVAHMPWRTFVYKALNTFIDDLFAFIMPMPILHRIATLRDDVVFLAYLYQRWIYGVDTSRPNEFGQVEEGKEKEE
ncbi:Cleft lip and palate transmembrane protein-like protein [Zancudomyces culisetae]|uniref:Cleft lip and palate transmembrane protein-like protein n=1 Tax=Zancudomyces culisetae TaxID=1213189 RepID=A0A1R1PW98_ZANCU|nr:Cleft lip and palate transmembrane protein-like protein [Zancudomyces culisetae]|eukprot:OMH85183.1 Cleft lip and palate transmembrane protein-like protein [Zancudomyces culisetae]